LIQFARWYARSGRNVRAKYVAENRGEFALSGQALRQNNYLKTIAKFEKYKMYGIDASRDKSRDFDLVSLTS
jgi:hypothetical protein